MCTMCTHFVAGVSIAMPLYSWRNCSVVPTTCRAKKVTIERKVSVIV